MEFDPSNNIVRLCIEGIQLEDKGEPREALARFLRAWDEATNDFERFLAAHFVARRQSDLREKLEWQQKSFSCALQVDSIAAKSALPSLHRNLARTYEELGDHEHALEHKGLAATRADVPVDDGPFYHGTRADLKIGDHLTPGGKSNYQADLVMNHIYFTALINGAGLAAALAKGDQPERVYIVEPLGDFEHDPNVTDKKFPGNLTRSYRTTSPFKIIGEVPDWRKQSSSDIDSWREKLANNKGEIIN